MNPLKSGTLDLALLAALQEQPRYGLDILKQVNARSGGLFDLREGSLYPALHRLVKAGWVESEWQPSDRGGAPRKVYRLTDSGRAALDAKREEWRTLRGALDALLLGRLRA
ncbi:helix-turn-helix transcriptional regulator [Deinococcus sp. SDU3-2]|uniref:Helix-turn-helix transcriptional regulator n=1 Tax=Deinococcus terrestris TaxID=2651870 RepID=A0A7X1NXU2_9DEIO|nr:PadR family transcriptional regulator [Deinococcus terrestris]MPY67386.1 helix-turn-helix transcriptional regulator [Deinococcus terrestris]